MRKVQWNFESTPLNIMEVQNKEIKEAASGKGVHHEPPHHGGVSQGAIGSDLNYLHWMNDESKVNDEKFQQQYKEMMSDIDPKVQIQLDDDTNRESNVMDSNSDDEMMQFDEAKDDEECKQWLNMYGRYVPPVPKFLIIRDLGRRHFSGENVIKRTIWIGKVLKITDRRNLPEMRKIEITREDRTKETIVTIVTDSKEQAEKLLTVNQIGPCKVRIEKDQRKNTVSGVLFDAGNYFKFMTEEDIMLSLMSEGVIKVTKIGKEASRSYRILFDRLKIPDRVKLLGENRSFPITEYIPPPLRCYKCQRYDHASSTCRKEVYTCQRCGGPHQNKTYVQGKIVGECRLPQKCIHCAQEHDAGFFRCPIQLKYVQVNRLMVNQKLSRFEAKSRVLSPYARSDAQVVTAAIRNEESRKEVEETKKQAAEDKEQIAAINKKLDAFMQAMETKLAAPSHASNFEESLDSKVLRAVEVATKKIKEENDRKFDQLQQQINEQNKTITNLTTKNGKLEEEASKLREQLAYEKAINAEIKKQPGGRTTVIKSVTKPAPPNPDPTTTDVNKRKLDQTSDRVAKMSSVEKLPVASIKVPAKTGTAGAPKARDKSRERDKSKERLSQNSDYSIAVRGSQRLSQ